MLKLMLSSGMLKTDDDNITSSVAVYEYAIFKAQDKRSDWW